MSSVLLSTSKWMKILLSACKSSFRFEHTHSNGQKFTYTPNLSVQQIDNNLWSFTADAPKIRGDWTLVALKVADVIST